MASKRDEASEIERQIQEQFNPSHMKRFTSTSRDEERSGYVLDLALPVEARGVLPLTRESLIVDENPARVEWERHIRTFLKKLPSETGHRITAPMIYEWTTGISIKELAAMEGAADREARGGAQNGSANMHLRHINAILKEYFGTPYKTRIAGREVGKAYKVRPSFRITRKRPVSITLLPDWQNGTLDD